MQWILGTLPLGLKRQGREADYSLPSSTEVKKTWNDYNRWVNGSKIMMKIVILCHL
jgi:hypothetical protein